MTQLKKTSNLAWYFASSNHCRSLQPNYVQHIGMHTRAKSLSDLLSLESTGKLAHPHTLCIECTFYTISKYRDILGRRKYKIRQEKKCYLLQVTKFSYIFVYFSVWIIKSNSKTKCFAKITCQNMYFPLASEISSHGRLRKYFNVIRQSSQKLDVLLFVLCTFYPFNLTWTEREDMFVSKGHQVHNGDKKD